VEERAKAKPEEGSLDANSIGVPATVKGCALVAGESDAAGRVKEGAPITLATDNGLPGKGKGVDADASDAADSDLPGKTKGVDAGASGVLGKEKNGVPGKEKKGALVADAATLMVVSGARAAAEKRERGRGKGGTSPIARQPFFLGSMGPRIPSDDGE
jgi:hypothetical protein